MDIEIRVCPKCGKIYKDYPALSRRDNKTLICSNCGVQEALDDFFGIFEEKDKKGDESNG